MESALELFSEIKFAGLLLDNTWKVRQNDRLDRLTSHIYECRTVAQLHAKAETKSLSDEERAYSLHRWRNFKRHDAWLALLSEQVPAIRLSPLTFHKTQDFLIRTEGDEIPFDLKVTRYPHSAPEGLGNSELAGWFYANQSRQGRFHLANRFFIVGRPEVALYDIDLARLTVASFAQSMASYRHWIHHSNGVSSRAVILRQSYPK